MAKLLLVEDDERVQRYMQRLLEKLGHTTVICGDGTSGFDAAADESIELMLLDLNLPGTPNGMNLVREIRKRRPNCPIVIVSGYPTSERIEECKQLGISDFLTKPFEMEFINFVIERLLAGTTKPKA